MEPLLKWPGGKRKLAKSIAAFFPPSFARYFEPFVGGGALFFHLLPASAYLSDKNADLVNAYTQIKLRPERLIRQLRKWHNSENEYYRIRAWAPSNDIERAARLIYLCTLSFNGIYRQNLRGEFNVPYNFKTYLAPCDENKIKQVSGALQFATLKKADFDAAVRSARSGDLVYFDPPYTVAHGNNGFLKYNASIFHWKDQERLARLAHDLADRGCAVYVSNADHYSIHALYKQFSVAYIDRHSVIAASEEFRKRVTECLFYAR